VDRARERVAALPGASAYEGLCTALRRQHDDEVAISAGLAAAAAAHGRARAAAARAEERLARAGAGGGGGGAGGGGDPVEDLRAEVARLREQVRGALWAGGEGAEASEGCGACGAERMPRSTRLRRAERSARMLPERSWPLWPPGQVDEAQPRELEAGRRRLAALQEALGLEVRGPWRGRLRARPRSRPGRRRKALIATHRAATQLLLLV
jgi:hypothetical protein